MDPDDCLTIWSLTTTLGGLATSFWQLAATRAGVALGEAASSHSAHLLIAETKAPKKRAFAIGICSMGVPIGIMAGLALRGN